MSTPRQVSFTVPAIPIAQPRQRHRVVSAGGRSFAQNYTPHNSPVNDYKAAVQFAATQAYQGAPHDGPVALAVVFVFPRPAGKRWKTKPMPRGRHCGKPDVDNLVKSLTDAMNGLVYVDDARISELTVHKVIAAGDEQPHCEINLTLF